MSNKKNITVIHDMQYGSTGKGLIAGYIAERDKPDVVCTAWGMNAGHTYINSEGRKFVHCMLANGVVSPNLKYVLIGPGSSIGLHRLLQEVNECEGLLQGVDIYIHPNATIIQQHHIDEESGPMTKIGSTKKGCGAALIEKIRRNPSNRITAFQLKDFIEYMFEGRNVSVCTHREYLDVVENAEKILVEGSQGYSLGMNSGFYPYTTSRECTPTQILSDSLLPMAKVEKIIGTMRTFPIRVANRFNENGHMVGWSGPCYPDQSEIDFETIGQTTEFTTVTKLPRRIFTFSDMQCRDAMVTCMPDEIFLNFANYLTDIGVSALTARINSIAESVGCGGVKYVGFGPIVDDVKIVEE